MKILKVNERQEGHSPVEAVLLLVIVALIAGVGWYVYRANQNTNSLVSTSVSSVSVLHCKPASNLGGPTYVNDTLRYCLSLPDKWHYSVAQVLKDDQGHVVKDAAGHPAVGTDTIAPIGGSADFSQGIAEVVADTSSDAPKTYFENKGAGRAAATGDGASSTINGYQVYTADIGGEASGKVVTVSNGKRIVEFLYYTNDPSNVAVNQKIISSLKFVN